MTTQVQINRYVCFPTTAFVIDKPDDVQLVLDVSKEYLKNQEEFHELNEIFPLYQTENFANDSRLNEFTSYINQVAYDILSDQGYDMSNKRTYVNSMWLQDHHKHSQMEQHVHGQGAQIIGFYFLDCPENCSDVLVHDPRPGKVQINLPIKNEKNYTEANETIMFESKTGRLFFANAWLPHSFTRNNSNKPIKFVHFSINVEQLTEYMISTSEAEVI